MIYRVKPGDTLYKIAQRFDTTVQELTQLNQLENINYLEVGQILIVPKKYDFDGDSYRFDNKIANGLLLVAFSNKYIYQPGEEVVFTLVKVNMTNKPITSNYSTEQRFDLSTGYGQQQWIWSAGRSFNQVIKEITLQPEESQVYTVVWQQNDNKGRQVDTGFHNIEIWNVANEMVTER